MDSEQIKQYEQHKQVVGLLDDIAYFTHITMHANYKHECDMCEDYGKGWKQ